MNRKWLPVLVRKEHILIKGGKSEVLDVLVTRHGPVINVLFKDAFPSALPLALRWTALEPGQAFLGIYNMNLAGDCRSFREAMRYFDDPSQNVVYADTQGNIAYSLSGRVPVRAKGDGTVPAPGWTGEYEWTGYVPFEAMPHLFNPPRGYIATANNQIQRLDYPIFPWQGLFGFGSGRPHYRVARGQRKDRYSIFPENAFRPGFIECPPLARAVAALQVSDPDLAEIVKLMAPGTENWLWTVRWQVFLNLLYGKPSTWCSNTSWVNWVSESRGRDHSPVNGRNIPGSGSFTCWNNRNRPGLIWAKANGERMCAIGA